MKYHFWYSPDQKKNQDSHSELTKRIVKNTYAIVKGYEVLYTEINTDKGHKVFEDAVYLGFGTPSRVERVKLAKKTQNKIVKNKIESLVPLTIKHDGDKSEITFELGGHRITRYCQTKQKLLFERGRIARLIRLVSNSTTFKRSEQLIEYYKNN